MRLSEILRTLGLQDAPRSGNTELDPSVVSIESDSRLVTTGALFVAIPGTQTDGRNYIEQAINAGAVAILAEGEGRADCPVPLITVDGVRALLGPLAMFFYDSPLRNTLNIGVTGTNGKTTVHWILAEALRELCGTTAQAGTLGVGLSEESIRSKSGNFFDSKNTTPDPLELHKFLSGLAPELALKCFVSEVSSIALTQARHAGIEWDAAVFTNLSRDHLDYHGSYEAYGEVKKAFFTDVLARSARAEKAAVINYDDSFGATIMSALSETKVRSVTFSTKSTKADAYVSAVDASRVSTRIEARVFGESIAIDTKLVGDYNVENILAAVLTLAALNFPLREIVDAIACVNVVPGRLETVSGAGRTGFIDYAHTPDALVRVQQSLRPLCSGRLITVFGCGGDRDRGKRPLMGRAVAEQADFAIVTSDNPRSEDPQQIIDEILPGFSKENSFKVIVERKQAIEHACRIAGPDDVILIAGKGHEDYQEVNGVRHAFSDKQICENSLRQLVENLDDPKK